MGKPASSNDHICLKIFFPQVLWIQNILFTNFQIIDLNRGEKNNK